GNIEQRAAAEEGAGKTHCFDQRMLHQMLAAYHAIGCDGCKQAAWHARFFDCPFDCPGHYFGSFRVSRMAFENDRTACGDCGRCITTGSREGKREVTCAKHHNNTNPYIVLPDIRFRWR